MTVSASCMIGFCCDAFPAIMTLPPALRDVLHTQLCMGLNPRICRNDIIIHAPKAHKWDLPGRRSALTSPCGRPGASLGFLSYRKIKKVTLSFTLRDLPRCSHQNGQMGKDKQAISVKQGELLSMLLPVWENEFKVALNLCHLMCYQILPGNHARDVKG